MTATQPNVLSIDPESSITREQAAAVVAAYADAMTDADIDRLANLFAEDATRRDPVGREPNHGREEIRAAFRKALPGAPTKLRFSASDLRGSGNVYAFSFEHTTTTDSGSRTLRGIDVFAFTRDGLIGDCVAYWGPGDLSSD